MKITFLLVVLFLVVKTADCTLPLKFSINPMQLIANATENNQPMPPDCDRLVKQNYVFPYAQSNNISALAKDIDSICKELKVIEPCFHALRKFATKESRVAIDFSLEKIPFLCSDKGKSGLKEYNDSPCSGIRTTQEIEERVANCVNTTTITEGVGLEARCVDARKIEKCAYTIYTELCGLTVGEFIRGINLALYRSIPIIQNCFRKNVVEVDHSLVYSSKKE